MVTIVRGSVLEQVSVKDFGAVGDGVTDDTAAIQAAVEHSYLSGNNEIVHFPAGRYLITDTIDLHPGTKLEGDSLDYGGIAGATSFPNQLSDSRGTVIIFNPSTQISLFVPALPKGGSSAWTAIAIKGFNIWGNSSMDDYHRFIFGDVSPVVTTSLYAIDFDEVQFSSVENVAIMGFVSGVREGERCQENTFTRVHIERCRESAIVYSAPATAAEPTSSVWLQCVFRTCLSGVEQKVGTFDQSLNIRFVGCYFEDLSNYLARLTRAARNWEFIGCYGESIAVDSSVGDRACFSIGQFGTAALPFTTAISITGGQYSGGPGAGGGTFLDIDESNGVNVTNCQANRFTTAIIGTANTRQRSVILNGFTFNTIATFYSGTAGVLAGLYKSTGLENASTVVIMQAEYMGNPGAICNLQGTDVRCGDGGTTIVRPGGDNTSNLGDGSRRWKEVFAVAPAINTSDGRFKTDAQDLNAAEKLVATALKGMIKTFKYTDSVDEKGDDARIHVGVIAQEVIAAFEAQGLDPMRYAMVCYNEWDEYTDVNSDGTEVVTPAGNRYGIRYGEMLAFIIGAI